MDPTVTEPSDEALLLAASDEPEAFALFYRRHVRAPAAYFWRRSSDAEVAADLTAETFAAALDGCRRFDPERGPSRCRPGPRRRCRPPRRRPESRRRRRG
jgi:hypothetical protein